MYQTGELVVYGSEGVCRVEAVGTATVTGASRDKEYYTLVPLYRSGRIFTPTDTPAFMRPVITREEAVELVRGIPSVEGELIDIRNLRYLTEHYQQTLRSHDCRGLVKLIKDIHLKRQHATARGRKLGQIDERTMKRAEDMLYGELAVALDIPREDVSGYINDAEEKLAAGEDWQG